MSRHITGVGEGGFEPPTSCSQSRCAARLRYSPVPSSPDLGFQRGRSKLPVMTTLGACMSREDGGKNTIGQRRPRGIAGDIP